MTAREFAFFAAVCGVLLSLYCGFEGLVFPAWLSGALVGCSCQWILEDRRKDRL